MSTESRFYVRLTGAVQQKTRSIIDMAQGKVLLIDEAYVLDDSNFGKQALDTIVELVFNKPGDDIAVIMAGYEPQIKKMIREQNPGLARRFNASNVRRHGDCGAGNDVRSCRRYESLCGWLPPLTAIVGLLSVLLRTSQCYGCSCCDSLLTLCIARSLFPPHTLGPCAADSI